jgi:16S rRNA (cytidine1402-2'-O)-methyltransferase
VTAGRLLLIPCVLADESKPAEVLPASVVEHVRRLDSFVVENAKSARAFLSACEYPRPIREVAMSELNEHTPEAAIDALLDPARQGRDLGLLSEAGVPAVADPGARLVAAAHAEGIRVLPLVGPSSILLALMASGLEGQRFRFHGYLPVPTEARRARLTQIERESAQSDETQVFIETPYRNDAMLADILTACRDDTRLAIAADLTGPGETIRMNTVAAWREPSASIGKRPAVFLLLAASRGRR